MSEDPHAPDGGDSLREISKDERNWAMACHLAALAGFVVPFGSIIGPLVVWLIKKDEFELVDRNGKESINFQISIVIYTIVAALSMFLLIGFLLLPAVMIFGLVMAIIAAVKTANGEDFEYPVCIRFIS